MCIRKSEASCVLLGRLGAIFLMLLVGNACNAAEQRWKPACPIEFVVGLAPGGNTDTTARVIQKILQQLRLVDVPITIQNKPGAGGAVAMGYLVNRPADGCTLMIGNTTLLSTHIVGSSRLTYSDVTPLAKLMQEYVVFAVKSDSPVKTGEGLLASLKQDPTSLSIAIGAAIGNQNHIAIALAAKSAGVDVKKLKTVIFKSAGETATAILGGHVDVGITSIGVSVPFLTAGTLRLVAVAAPKRQSGALAEVPTWREQGANSVAGNWYAVYGPKYMGLAQVQYWDGIFAKVVMTDEWKWYVAEAQATTEYLNSEQTGEFFKTEYETLKSTLTELGLAK